MQPRISPSRIWPGIVPLVVVTAISAIPNTPQVPLTDWPQAKFLYDGRLADGEAELSTLIQADPNNRQARFGLGVTRFLRASETLAQSLHRYGLSGDGPGGFVPILRLPVPKNPNPEPVTPADLRAALTRFVADLAAVDETLKPLDETEVKLPIDLARVRLDLNGDGTASDAERLWSIYQTVAFGARGERAANGGDQPQRVVFDRGDVAWLRGYAHLLSALAEVTLAYDMHELFEHCAHLAFAQPQTPYAFLKRGAPDTDPFSIADVIAAVHLVRFPVKEPERMPKALAHLEECIALSRESWRLYEAETDDDHEWIPNANQTLFLANQRGIVSREMITGWSEFLDEFESILAGKTLVPFHRDLGGSRGINLRRVFMEPREFDLVLWVQGTAAVPYLEEGSITKPEVWDRLQRTFRGEFFGFAMWFN